MKKTIRLLQTWAAMAAAVILTQITTAQDSAAGQRTVPGYASPASHVRVRPLQPAATTSPTGFTPAQIRQAYGFDQLSLDGTGQTIAIIDAFGDCYETITTNTVTVNHKTTQTYTTNYFDSTEADWTTFCNQFGLATGGLTVVYPQGQGSVDKGWALETALDIQWAHAIAPGAKIMLVISKDNSWANLYSAVDYAVNNGANIVSMSWGGREYSGEVSDDAHFNYPGVTFLAASMDSGEVSSGVFYPSASPYVVAVGGTQLTNYNGTWSETAWSGSGGGISLYEGIPAFQNGWQQYPTGNMRSVPDVAFQGGPNPGVSVHVTPYYNGWIQVYGTSVGTPQWAALIALANSGRATTLGTVNPALYSTAATGTTPPNINTTLFKDIISGSNGSDPDDFAIPGYDFVTGLGSPSANNLVPALASWAQSPDFTLSITPASETLSTAGGTATYTVPINRVGGFSDGVNLSVAASPPLPAGASASFSPNPATGDSSTLGVTVPAGTAAGTYSLTITGVGTVSGQTHAASATLVVGNTVTVVSPSGASGYSISGGNKHSLANLLVTVALQDSQGQPVAGASVSIELYLNGTPYASASGNTLSDGTVTFQASHAPLGAYSTAVTSVSASGLTWDGTTPANNYSKTQ